MQDSLGKKEKGRKFQSSCSAKYKWLEYKSDKDKVFCNLCTSAISQGMPIPTVESKVDSYKSFVENGFSALKKALQTFQRHEQSELHRASAAALHSSDANVTVETMIFSGRRDQMLKTEGVCVQFSQVCVILDAKGKL